MNKDHLQV